MFSVKAEIHFNKKRADDALDILIDAFLVIVGVFF